MKGKRVLIGMGLVGLALAAGVTAKDRDHRLRVATALKSIEEVPSISSPASGFFRATIDIDNQTIAYELSYDEIAEPAQAHIHLGQAAVNGGISVFLCTNLGNGPAGTPPCPGSPARISHTLTAAEIVGPANQGLAAGELAELVAAIKRGVTYVNVHSAAFPAGEIRGQLDRPDRK